MAVYATKYLFVTFLVLFVTALFVNGVDPQGATPARRWRAPFLPRQATPPSLREDSTEFNEARQAAPSQHYVRQDGPSPHVRAGPPSPSRRNVPRQATPSPHHARQLGPSRHVEARQSTPSQHHRRAPSSQHDVRQADPSQRLKGREERPSPHLAARQAKPSHPYFEKRDDGHTAGAPMPSQTHGKRSLIEQEIMTGEDSRHNFCPTGLSACPILSVPGVLPVTLVDWEAVDYECVDFSVDLRSCGGCSSMDPEKHDCRTLPHVLAVSCVAGECVVTSCQPGYNLQADGQTCSRS